MNEYKNMMSPFEWGSQFETVTTSIHLFFNGNFEWFIYISKCPWKAPWNHIAVLCHVFSAIITWILIVNHIWGNTMQWWNVVMTISISLTLYKHYVQPSNHIFNFFKLLQQMFSRWLFGRYGKDFEKVYLYQACDRHSRLTDYITAVI